MLCCYKRYTATVVATNVMLLQMVCCYRNVATNVILLEMLYCYRNVATNVMSLQMLCCYKYEVAINRDNRLIGQFGPKFGFFDTKNIN